MVIAIVSFHFIQNLINFNFIVTNFVTHFDLGN